MGSTTLLGTTVTRLLLKVHDVADKLSFWLGGLTFARRHRGAVASTPVPEALRPVPAGVQKQALRLLLGLLQTKNSSIANNVQQLGANTLLTASQSDGSYDSTSFEIAAVDMLDALQSVRKGILKKLLQRGRLSQVHIASRPVLPGKPDLAGLKLAELLDAVSSEIWGAAFVQEMLPERALQPLAMVNSDEDLDLQTYMAEAIRALSEDDPDKLPMAVRAQVLRISRQLRRSIHTVLYGTTAGSGGDVNADSKDKLELQEVSAVETSAATGAYEAFLLHMLDRLPDPGKAQRVSR